MNVYTNITNLEKIMKLNISNKRQNLKKNGKRKELIEKMKPFNSFLVFIESEFKKIFGYFIPCKFEITGWKKTEQQFCFYYINDNQELITCSRTSDPEF